MRTLARYALNIGAAALFASCGGSQLPVNSQSQVLNTTTQPVHADHGAWTLPDAKGDLLYEADENAVFIVSYPGGKKVATLTSDANWPRVCSDPNNGDVFVDGTDKMYEYTHGGTTPIATLSAPSRYDVLSGCSVDPKSGDLAVVNYGPPAALLVYHHHRGKPRIYVGKVTAFYYPGYDDRGNIFVLGYGDNSKSVYPVFTELPAGGSGFVNITLSGYIQYAGKVQWDGTYLALTLGGTIYRVSVSGSSGTIVSVLRLIGDNEFGGGISWIRGGAVVAPYGDDFTRRPGIWPYPAGGNVDKVLPQFSKDRHDSFGDMTISLATRGH